MKTDLYTKFVLTVIAMALTVICFKGSISDANADGQGLFKFSQNGALIVTICDANGDGHNFNCAQADKLER